MIKIADNQPFPSSIINLLNLILFIILDLNLIDEVLLFKVMFIGTD